MKKLRRRLWFFGIGLLLGMVITGLWFLYRKAGEIVYYHLSYQEWISQRPAQCTPTMKEQTYRDMRPNNLKKDRPLELSCEQAAQLPATDHFVKNEEGLNIHYRLYPAPTPQAPLWLYVHGITADYLNGARYYPVSKRLGFRLAIMELRNHGISGNNRQGASYGCHERVDVVAVIQDLLKRFPDKEILIMGTSMGSMSVAVAASALQESDKQHQIKAVVLENPIPSLRTVVLRNPRIKEIPTWLQNGLFAMTSFRANCDLETWAPALQIQHLKRPVFVPISQHDDTVPVDLARQVYAALPQGLPHVFKVYPHGKHAAIWNGQPQEYEADMRDFWKRATRSNIR